MNFKCWSVLEDREFDLYYILVYY